MPRKPNQKLATRNLPYHVIKNPAGTGTGAQKAVHAYDKSLFLTVVLKVSAAYPQQGCTYKKKDRSCP